MPTTATTSNELPVVQLSGEPSGAVQVGEEFLTAPIKTALLHQVVLAQRASLRAGTADTKRRSEVSGGGKKPWKQKHTGRARAGSIRSPLWRHGGIIFGPHPRDFSYRLPATMRRAGLLEALRAKARDQELTLVDSIASQDGRTKTLAKTKVLQNISVTTLIVLERLEPMTVRALRNLDRVTLIGAAEVTAFQLVNHRRVIMTKNAWAIVAGRCREARDE